VALGLYFSPAGMTAAKYKECIARLKKAGSEHPAGRSYHVCFGSPEKLEVFDVWESQGQFDAFGATLMPILQALEVETGSPMISSVHNVIVPPAKATPKAPARKAAARKAKPRAARKAAPRRKAKRK
jgi:hypothetical protein